MAMISPNRFVNIAKWDENTKCFHHFCNVEFGHDCEDKADEKFEELTKRFPVEEGWMLIMHNVECYSTIARTASQEELC